MAGRSSHNLITQSSEDSSDDGSYESPGLPRSTQQLEQETFFPLDKNQTLDRQIPAGVYIFVLSKPTEEMFSEERNLFDPTNAFPCPTPWFTCPGPPRPDGRTRLDPGCQFIWICYLQIPAHIRAAGYFQPTHNLFHWGPRTEYGAHSCHAYAIGPIFDPDHVVPIGCIVRDFQFKGYPDYPALGPYIYFHRQDDHGVIRNGGMDEAKSDDAEAKDVDEAKEEADAKVHSS